MLRYRKQFSVMLLVLVSLIGMCLLIGTKSVKAATVYWVSTTGNDNNPGTEELPFRTIQKAANVAQAGDTVKIKAGVYAETVTVPNSGTADKPIVFESETRWGAIMRRTDVPNLFDSAKTNGQYDRYYITLRGIWFKDTPVAPTGDHGISTVNPAKGWTIEDCRFTNCGVGIRLDYNHGNMDGVKLIRTIGENMKVNTIYSYGKEDLNPRRRIKDLLLKDCIIRRNNTNNQDPSYHAGALKYMDTDNLIVDGLISYDNNGSGCWIDWDNYNFVVKNCTLFGNHASGTKWWAGVGLWVEANPDGIIENNVIYSNLAAGLGVLENGFQGGTTIINNIFVDNNDCIEFRAMKARGGIPNHVLGEATITGNLFKDWRQSGWRTNIHESGITATTPGAHGIYLDNNNYDQGSNSTYGQWINNQGSTKTAYSLADLRNVLLCEANGTNNAVDFDGPLHTVTASLGWQIPSAAAEANNIDNAISEYSVGQTVTIPVTGRKAITQNGSYWETEFYDLQARYVKVTMDSASKAWVEANVRPYASTAQTNVTVTLTRKEPYAVEATMISGGPTPTPTPAPTPTPYEIRVNCGASTSYTDSTGNTWVADRMFSTGSWGYIAGSAFSTSHAISGTTDDPLYQTERCNTAGNLEYRFTVPNGYYNLVLKHAEIGWNAPDKRKFNIVVEGVTKESNVDIYAQAGHDAALDKIYDNILVTDGVLNIVLEKVTDNPQICAISVVAAPDPTPTPTPIPTPTPTPTPYEIRVNCGASTGYTDSTGNTWVADRMFSTGSWGYIAGSAFSTSHAISGTTDDPLYQTERCNTAGNLEYRFTVPNGYYNLVLKHAEIGWNAPDKRKFNIVVEGVTKESNVDIYAQAGHDAALDKIYDNILVTDGVLNIVLEKVTDNPQICAISVVSALDPAPTPTPTPKQPIIIQAEAFDSQSGIYIEGGDHIAGTNTNDWVCYNNVNLGSGYSKFTTRVACPNSGGHAHIRLDSPTGTLIGTLDVPNTGSWSTYTEKTVSLTGASGTHNIYIVFQDDTGGGSGNYDWFKFSD